MKIKKIGVILGMLSLVFAITAAPAHAAVDHAFVVSYNYDSTDLLPLVMFIDSSTNTIDQVAQLTLPLASTTDPLSFETNFKAVIQKFAVDIEYPPMTQILNLPFPEPQTWVFNYPTLAVNTARQASATRSATVSASVDVTASLSLVTGQTGKVALQYANDSAFTSGVTTVQQGTNGNTGSLAIGLNLGQTVTATVTGDIPAGKYYRLQTTNVTGTPTYGTPVIQEVLK